jgi:hypothetical protein
MTEGSGSGAGSVPYLRLTDPDPGGPKHRSGSSALLCRQRTGGWKSKNFFALRNIYTFITNGGRGRGETLLFSEGPPLPPRQGKARVLQTRGQSHEKRKVPVPTDSKCNVQNPV